MHGLTRLRPSPQSEYLRGWKDWAIAVGISRKSYWRLSRTMATQWGMNDAWLESQGLVSVRNLWIAFHYPAASQSGLRGASR